MSDCASQKRWLGLWLSFWLLLAPAGNLCLADENTPLAKQTNEELLAKAERTFLMRNFLASEKYYRELHSRLLKQLSSLQPTEQQPSEKHEQIEIEEELILAPFGLGHSLIYLHRYSEALPVLESGIKIYPDWAHNHVSLLFFQDPLFTGPIISDLERIMKSSEDPVAWLLHGYILFFSDNLQQASKSFAHVLETQKDNYLARYFMGQIKVAEKEDPGILLESFNPGQIDKLTVDELIKYGSLFFKKADYQAAARLFKTAIEKKNDSPVVHIAYGDSLFALGRFEEAAEAIVKGLEIYPKYAESRINRRDFYSNPSEFDSQLENLEAYVNSNPSNPNARFLLGYNYFFIQDYDKADQQFQAVLTNRFLHSSARHLHNLIRKFQTQRNHQAM